MFRVYDYTNATRLLGVPFNVKPAPTTEAKEKVDAPKEKIIQVEGFDVHINPAGKYIITKVGNNVGMVTVEEYAQMIASRLIEKIKTVDELRSFWIDPEKRRELISSLPEGERGLRLLRELKDQQDYDIFDILAEIGFGVEPRRRKDRVSSFQYKHKEWLDKLSQEARDTLLAIATQFEKGGIEELENPRIFQIPDVVRKGGLDALKIIGNPQNVILETKKRLLAA